MLFYPNYVIIGVEKCTYQRGDTLKNEEKTVAPIWEDKDPELLQVLAQLRFIDDMFMSVIFNDIPTVTFLLRQILERDDLIVKTVKTHHELKNLNGRSVILDIFAVDKKDKRYNIEIQRSNSGAVLRRARYNSSLMDADITKPGDNYDDLPDTYVIFITENDIFKEDLPLYHIDCVIRETGKFVDDGTHIIYVNGSKRDKTNLGWVMHDFFCTDPDEMHYKIFADRARSFKVKKKGVDKMCEALEKLKRKSFDEGRAIGFEGGEKKGEKKGEIKGKAQMAVGMASMGISVEQIAKAANCDTKTVKSWIDKSKSQNY